MNNSDKEGGTLNRLATYKVRAERISKVRDALAKFVEAAKDQGPKGIEIAIFSEKDGLTYHHHSSFPTEQAYVQHGDSTYFAEFWEVLYECCETFAQSVELELIHTINT